MNKLSDLMGTVYECKEKLTDAEKERDGFLEPILRILGATGGGITHVASVYSGTLSITREGSCRGCGWSDSYDFPVSIFESDDPLVAATEYVTKKKEAADRSAKAEKIAQLNRLQKELAES